MLFVTKGLNLRGFYGLFRGDVLNPCTADGRERADSDVDLLVEFSSPQVSLLTLNSLKYKLEELLEADVDLVHGPLPEGSMIEIGRRISLYGA